ncbi:MAG: hypothetical protein BWK76_14370 [Desulfobulbaceae bacterium A2]|nr:MAG: hypothetical protein BWK76_14370 [Desulfobulbaceae bacterium A2]
MRSFVLVLSVLLTISGLAPRAVAAPRVESFVPQGSVKDVRQVQLRFSEPMVAFGNPRLPDPCIHDLTVAGSGRWVDERNWVLDLARPLPGGIRGKFMLKPELRALSGARVAGPTTFSFDTGAPAIVRSLPGEGEADVDEQQTFVLRLDAPVTSESVVDSAWFEVEGINERLGVAVVSGEERERYLTPELRRQHTWFFEDEGDDLAGRLLVIRCRRGLPPDSDLRLVWGAGIASLSGVVADSEQVLEFKTRPAFTLAFQCTKVNAQAQCVPFLPMALIFSAPVPVAQAQNIRLLDASGRVYPMDDLKEEQVPVVEKVSFSGPFPEKTTFRLELPPALFDDAGRRPENLSHFPLAVATDEYPPLIKFSGAFGIIELNEGGVLPVTVRNLEAQVAGRKSQSGRSAEKGVPGRMLRVSQDREIVNWLKKVREADQERYEEAAGPDGASRLRNLTGSTSVFGPADRAVSFVVPRSTDPREFEVAGIPLTEPGLHVVELMSPRLGAALMGEARTRHVATAALVTNMAVHFKWGRESSLVWVTSLDSAQPVAEAEIRVSDACSGVELWRGKSGVDGTARIEDKRLPQPNDAQECYSGSRTHPLFVSARSGKDLSFTFSGWNQGIQPGMNFRLPVGSPLQSRVAHTVFDRSLLQAGETVSMKHVIRLRTGTGFAIPASELPDRVRIRHRGSGDRYEALLTFDQAGIAETHWTIPREAKLGEYEVVLQRGDAWWADGGILHVEQFRIPTMKAVVQPVEPFLVGAREATFDLFVSYLGGGAAGRLPVTLRTQAQPRSITMPGYPGFSFGGRDLRAGMVTDSGEEEDAPAEGSSPVQVLPLTLDASGGARVTVTGLPPVERPRELLAELEYQDANGERGTVARRIPLWPARVMLGIKPEGWAASSEQLRFQVLALDLAGKPAAGQELRVELLHSVTTSYRKRMIGGFYAYENRTELRRLDTNCQGRAGENGLLACELAPGVSGNVVLRASTTDAQGNVAFSTQDVWVAGGEDWWFEQGAGDRMDLLPERKAYEHGEKARLQVKMPFREATALVTVEREGVLDAFVTKLSGKEPVVELPIRPNYAPNVYVSVLALRPRLPERFGAWWRGLGDKGDKATPEHPLSSTVDLNKPAFRLGMAAIDVGWAPNRLEVLLETDHEVYQVRDQARVRVAVRRADGGALPAGAEIAFAAVDEGLLELKPNESWKLLEHMMGRRGIEVKNSTAQMQVVGKRHYGRKAVPHGGGGGKATARELFDTLLFWQGRVVLDDAGQAQLTVPLNDSLTSFRLVAVAQAGSELFGTGQTSIRTSRDLMLHSGLAPMVREGDGYRALFTVRNATQRSLEVTANARVRRLRTATPPGLETAIRPEPLLAGAEGSSPGFTGDLLDLSPQRLTLAPGEAREVAWQLEAPSRAETLQWEVAAESGDGSAQDLLRVSQRVTTPVVERVWQATLTRIDRPYALRVERPEGALPERGGIRVALRPRLADSLGGVRDAMRRYPYSCLEQKVSKAVALRDSARWQEVVRELPTHIDRDGLLKYFAIDGLQGSDVLSAYVLSIAHEAGWELPEDSRRRLLEGLRSFVNGRVQRPGPLAAADLVLRKLTALETLSRYGQAKPEMLESITATPQLWPTSALLDWCAVLQRVEGIPQAETKQREAQRILRSRLSLQGSTLGFSSEKNDALWWLMVSPDQNAARLILHMLDQPEERRQDLPRLVTGFMARQQRGSWQTTLANAWGTLAMEKFSDVYESETVSGITSASLNWQNKDMDWQEAIPRPALEFPWPEESETLEIHHEGAGAPWAVIQSRAAIPLNQPVFAGYRIERRLSPVVQQHPGQWSRGDVARVQLVIEATADMTWVVVDDPVPAGASILGGGLGRDSRILSAGERPAEPGLTPTYLERRFEALRAYYAYMPAGRWTLEYTVRCNTPGRFQLPPTRVEAMYAPEMFGEIPNLPLEIMQSVP